MNASNHLTSDLICTAEARTRAICQTESSDEKLEGSREGTTLTWIDKRLSTYFKNLSPAAPQWRSSSVVIEIGKITAHTPKYSTFRLPTNRRQIPNTNNSLAFVGDRSKEKGHLSEETADIFQIRIYFLQKTHVFFRIVEYFRICRREPPTSRISWYCISIGI